MLNWNNKDIFLSMMNILHDDQIVLAASDTVLGLFSQLSEKSKNKLDSIKKRHLKPYIVLIKSTAILSKFTDQLIDPVMQQIIDQYWPGPLTIVFKAKADLPNWMVSPERTIAIRIPSHEGLQALLQSLDGLFTTSANVSDQPLPYRYNDIDPVILDQVKLVCCDKNIIYDGLASTLIDFSSGSIKVLRSGATIIDSI